MSLLESLNHVDKFLTEWVSSPQRDPNSIHGINIGSDREVELTVADLRLLVRACNLTAEVLIKEGASGPEADVKWRQTGPHKELVDILGIVPEREPLVCTPKSTGENTPSGHNPIRRADPGKPIKKGGELQLFNGRGYVLHGGPDPRLSIYRNCPHIFIAAWSRADAVRLIGEYLGRAPRGTETELRDYFHQGCWGNPMAGITPERGLWAEFERENVVRLF